MIQIEQLNKMNINLNDIKEMVSECLYHIVNSVLYENKSLPKLLYHKSSINNRKSILKNGLIPSVGDSYKAHWDDRDDLVPYVFLYDHNTINDGEYDSTYDDDIYSIDTSKLDIEHLSNDIDSYMHGCFVYDKKIPPKAIHLIYKGSTKDSKNLSSHSYIYKNTNKKNIVSENYDVNINFKEFNFDGEKQISIYRDNDEMGYVILTFHNSLESLYSEIADTDSYDMADCVIRHLKEHKPIIEIADIDVNRNYRNQGVSKRLIEYILKAHSNTQFYLRVCPTDGVDEQTFANTFKRYGFIEIDHSENGIFMIKP